MGAVAAASKPRELVALGVGLGANSHALLEFHVGAALAVGLELRQVKSALKMAGYVQQRAAAITSDEVTRILAAPVQPWTCVAILPDHELCGTAGVGSVPVGVSIPVAPSS